MAMAMAMAMDMGRTARTSSSKGPDVTRVQNAARALRWPLGLTALVVAYGAFDYSSASNQHRVNPEVAYRSRPTDPGSVAAAMNDRVAVRNQFQLDERDASNIRAAIGMEPLNRVLLRSLGVRSDIVGDRLAAFQAMQIGDRVSRRDPITQLWLAEYARRQARPVTELRHYNAAMLVKPDLQKIVFPVLIRQISDPRYIDSIRPYILDQYRWTESFAATAAYQDFESTYRLIQPIMSQMASKGFERVFAQVIFRLAARGRVEDAMAVSKQAFQDIDVRHYSDANIIKDTLDPRLGTLRWKFDQTGDVNSVVEGKAKFSVSILPLVSGQIATRDIFVEPSKRYRLEHQIEYSGSADRALIRWAGGCFVEDKLVPLWEADVPRNSTRNALLFNFTVPGNCHVMRLTANAFGPEGQIPSDFLIKDLAFGPARSLQQ